jgi:hypothetical protein
MQYILSEEEYAALKAVQSTQLKLGQKKLQTLCSKICDTMPVHWGWGGPDPKPWSCILTRSPPDQDWYCDKCPVTEICPHPCKEWSQ